MGLGGQIESGDAIHLKIVRHGFIGSNAWNPTIETSIDDVGGYGHHGSINAVDRGVVVEGRDVLFSYPDDLFGPGSYCGRGIRERQGQIVGDMILGGDLLGVNETLLRGGFVRYIKYEKNSLMRMN